MGGRRAAWELRDETGSKRAYRLRAKDAGHADARHFALPILPRKASAQRRKSRAYRLCAGSWPLGEDIDRKNSDHHSALFDLLGVHNGSAILREEFAQKIDAIRKNPRLTLPGQRDEIAALVHELRTEERLMRFQRVLAREEKRAQEIKH